MRLFIALLLFTVSVTLADGYVPGQQTYSQSASAASNVSSQKPSTLDLLPPMQPALTCRQRHRYLWFILCLGRK